MRIVFWSLLLWLFVRIFIFQSFQIPSSSMHPTLIEGDHIFVNKLAYGARIPITPLSLPMSETYLDWIQIPYLRLPGFSSVKHDDIIVFNYPMDDDLPIDERKGYVKRCVGLPGDTIKIKKGITAINGKDEITSFKPIRAMDSSIYSPACFPNDARIKWNPDNFGPLYIPKKGESIVLNKKNILLYKRVIEKYEGNILKIKNDSVFINEHYRVTYSFKMNYYFAMGDNRSNSVDSRFWGFVPESHLIGRVSH
jgi:signal peptidase I